ncbi:cytochrome b5-like heme/steroid binding domain-containing protein [Melampsora americana]|nr:cytochrome b5-like heme/steroid binding domain-containing protein [Melampsora americana]
MSIFNSELWITCLPYLSNPINSILLFVLGYTIIPLFPSFKFDDLSSAEEVNEIKKDLKIETSPIQYNWKPAKLPDSVVWRTYTPLELRSFDGANGGKILFAIKKLVYDLSSGRNFYGPDGPYGNFAGRDASRGLAKQTFEESILTPIDAPIDDLSDLTELELNALSDWEMHFKAKYVICGELIENSERASRPL